VSGYSLRQGSHTAAALSARDGKDTQPDAVANFTINPHNGPALGTGPKYNLSLPLFF